MNLEEVSKVVFEQCMVLKPGESVLIIYDENTEKIAKALESSAMEITDKGATVMIPVGRVSGEEPPDHVSDMMKNYDVIIMPTTKSLTHTEATRNACKAGARAATMPGITEEIFTRVIPVDYEKMDIITKKLSEILTNGKTARIISDLGTDITLSIDGRDAKPDDGIYDKKGMFGNLPAGEAFLAPIEKTANGVFFIDASISAVEKINQPIKVIVKDGFAVSIEGGEEARILNEKLESFDDNNVFNIAEFGIGTNENAKIVGNPLEDEKVLGTCHLAFGKSSAFGGLVDAPLHIDGIIDKPTIFIDDNKIMEKGKLLV